MNGDELFLEFGEHAQLLVVVGVEEGGAAHGPERDHLLDDDHLLGEWKSTVLRSERSTIDSARRSLLGESVRR